MVTTLSDPMGLREGQASWRRARLADESGRPISTDLVFSEDLAEILDGEIVSRVLLGSYGQVVFASLERRTPRPFAKAQVERAFAETNLRMRRQSAAKG